MEVCPDIGLFSLPFYALVLAVTPPIDTDYAAAMAKVLVWDHTPLCCDDLI